MSEILRKTEAGQMALQARDGSVKLPVRLRTLLLQIDGQKDSDQLVHLALSLGNQPEALDKMIEMGLIEVVVDAAPMPPVAAPLAATDSTTVVDTAIATKDEPPLLTQEITENDGDDVPDLPVSSKLPEHLRAVAAQMRDVADKQLGLKALLLKRRISHSETEQELRQALVALNDALSKATNSAKAADILADILAQLPIIGLNRPKAYRG